MNEPARSAVLQNIRALMEFLQKHPPFNQMAEADLAWLVEHCSMAFFASGDVVLGPEDGEVTSFYILKQGLIQGERPQGREPGQTTFEITPGECFPLAALLGERETRSVHRAVADSFCLILPKADFVRLFSRSAPFRDFCLRGVSSLLDQVNQQVQLSAAQTIGSRHSLDMPLREIVSREPVVCAPETPLREAVGLMHERGVGSIVVTHANRQPLGIFTLRDLRRVAAAPGSDFAAPVQAVMTAEPHRLPPDASAFEAAILMARHHIAHVALVDQDRLVGVVSERDLFALQRVDLVHLARAISNAGGVESLAAMRADIHRLIDVMMAQGAGALQLNRIITLLNDHMVQRAIELAIEETGTPPVEFCWLAFGSEGRREQALHTDQDNGILFEADSAFEVEDIRRQLLPLAKIVNQILDRCGFPLCKGNIMASNPELCRSRNEWVTWFERFIGSATPENLLNSSIYFDLRAVWGASSPVAPMLDEVLGKVRRNTLFQRMLAADALRFRPPLGIFRNFVYSKKESASHSIDLKLQGLSPFIASARVLALANGISEANSVERLKLLVSQGALRSADVSAWEEAYGVIQLLRMRQHQTQLRAGQPLSNLLDPDSLNELDRRILKESFRQAQRLQQVLELRYNL